MLYDRSYMRETAGPTRWWNSATTVLLVANAVVYVGQLVNQVYLGLPIEGYLALSPEGLARGFLWQLLTFQFLHAGTLHFLFNELGLYFFGRAVEPALGKARLFEVYFTSGVTGGLLQGLLGWGFPQHFGAVPTVGASAGVFGLIAVFALLDPDQTILAMFFFPIRAYNFLILSLVITVFFVLVPAEPGVAHAAHLGGILAAMAYVRWILRAERRLFNWRPYRQVVRARELVHSGAVKRASWSRRPTPIPDDLPSAEFISREVDPILDKISAHGIQSLTERERRILEAARAKMSKR